MPKVLQVLGRSTGGVARHVAAISGGIREDDITIEVAGPPDLPVEIPLLMHHVVIPDGPVRGHWAAIGSLEKIIRAGDFDLVHAHGLRAAIDCAVACRRAGVPQVMSMHNLIRADIMGRMKAAIYRRGEGFAVRASEKTFAPSEEIARHLRSTVDVDPSRIEVLLLGVGEPSDPRRSPEEVRREWGVPEGMPVIVSVARLSPQKALHVLLEALQRLEGVHLVVVGDGPLEGDLRVTAGSLGIEDRVVWAGFRDDVHDQLRAADVFCLTSVWEAVSLAVQEAVLLRVPVVASDVGGIPELIQDEVTGLLFPKGDVDALVHALDRTLTDRAAAEERAEAASELLRSRFSTSQMLARLIDSYRSIGDVR